MTIESLSREEFGGFDLGFPKPCWMLPIGSFSFRTGIWMAKVSSAPVIDLSRLLDAVISNYLVGNNDAHGKNYSLSY
jgi:hypothetical protein